MMAKTGIAIITCDRPDLFEKCAKSVCDTHSKLVDHLLVVNDGEQTVDPGKHFDVIHNKHNVGVGKSKNKAIKNLIKLGCKHIFVVEDDICFANEHVVNKYITLSKTSGVKHLNYCLHGTANKQNGKAKPKLIIDYKHVKMALYHNVTGALSYYHKDVIKTCGLMDLKYKNAMEHVDHTMRIIKAGYHPPFRWFADVADSDQLLIDQDQSLSSSKIRKTQDWQHNFQFGVRRFQEIHSINVCDPSEPVEDKQHVVQFLKDLRK